MGKFFKALQKSKKERPPAVHTSRARGVKRPVQFSEEVKPQEKIQPKQTVKAPAPTPEPVKKDPRAQTDDFDLGAIHGLLGGDDDTESPRVEKSAEVVSEKHLTELSDRDLPSIHDLIDEGLSDIPTYEHAPQTEEKPGDTRQGDTPGESAEVKKEPLSGLTDDRAFETPSTTKEKANATEDLGLIKELKPVIVLRKNADALFDSAKTHFEKGEYSKVVAYSERFLKKFPKVFFKKSSHWLCTLVHKYGSAFSPSLIFQLIVYSA